MRRSKRLVASIVISLMIAASSPILGQEGNDNRLRQSEEIYSLYKEWIARQKEQFGADSPSMALPLSLFGSLLVERREYKEAVPYLEQALAISEKANEKKLLLTSLYGLRRCYRETKDLTKGAQTTSKIVAIQETLVGRDSPDLLPYLEDLQDHYSRTSQQKEEDEVLSRLALLADKSSFQTESQKVDALIQLARKMKSRDRNDEYKSFMERAGAIAEKTSGISSTASAELGQFYCRIGSFEKAASFMSKAPPKIKWYGGAYPTYSLVWGTFSITEAMPEGSHPARSLLIGAINAQNKGKSVDAIGLFQKAAVLAANSKSGLDGIHSLHYSFANAGIADIYLKQKRYRDAAPALKTLLGSTF